jgi:hypothetical protein
MNLPDDMTKSYFPTQKLVVLEIRSHKVQIFGMQIRCPNVGPINEYPNDFATPSYPEIFGFDKFWGVNFLIYRVGKIKGIFSNKNSSILKEN